MNLESYNKSIFESIKHVDENCKEYWEARELQGVLEYSQWRRFESVISRAKEACFNSEKGVSEHFAGVGKTLKMPNKASKIINDYKLSRYACYLIVQNGDPRKEIIALGQTYFAVQTRRQELLENNYENLNELQKRVYNRNLTKKGNYNLNQIAKKSGVKNFNKFHNCGYKGLYNGETANDIAKRKNLRYREDILDNMGSDELIANLFRISQTEQKLKNKNVEIESEANQIHYQVGKKVRQTIKELGGDYARKFTKSKRKH